MDGRWVDDGWVKAKTDCLLDLQRLKVEHSQRPASRLPSVQVSKCGHQVVPSTLKGMHMTIRSATRTPIKIN